MDILEVILRKHSKNVINCHKCLANL